MKKVFITLMIIGSLVGLAWQGNTFFGLQDEIAAKNEYIDDITNCEYTTIGYDLNDDMKNAVDFITFESDGKNYRVDVHGQVTFSSEKKYIATDEWIISYEDGLKSEGDPVVVEVAFEAKYFMFNHILNNEWTKDVVITPEYIMLSNGERCIYIFRVENVYMFYSELNAGVPITYNPPMKTIKQNYLLTFSMDGEEVYNVNDYSDPKGKYMVYSVMGNGSYYGEYSFMEGYSATNTDEHMMKDLYKEYTGYDYSGEDGLYMRDMRNESVGKGYILLAECNEDVISLFGGVSNE